ncbi:MAG: HpaII family restriction endonuclease [Streptococcaceae bacterium]|jgi:hypothetical protein|nr:HpaII family restriction endonuclease [Streptococcaceae bacterium]
MANKGEWAEHYAFFKVLSDQRLTALDRDTNLMSDLYYNVIEIIRDYRKENESRFKIQDSKVSIVNNVGQVIRTEKISDFTEKAKEIKSEILSGNTGSEILDNILEFEKKLGITQMKASSSDKADIVIKVHDFNTNLQPELAFSIKSQWGGAATLVNAGKTTNFIYRLIGDLSTQDIEQFNELKKFDEKSQKLKQVLLDFENCASETFEDNLAMIDTLMSTILSEILKEYYFDSFAATGKRIATIPELVSRVSEQHPEFRSKKHIEYKVKQYLFAVALGMTPSREWLGRYEANGGYLIVKSDGEIGIYHLINLNEFQDYLFYNTKLETASTGRHEFGFIYKEDNANKIKLNLQIRFCD